MKPLHNDRLSDFQYFDWLQDQRPMGTDEPIPGQTHVVVTIEQFEGRPDIRKRTYFLDDEELKFFYLLLHMRHNHLRQFDGCCSSTEIDLDAEESSDLLDWGEEVLHVGIFGGDSPSYY